MNLSPTISKRLSKNEMILEAVRRQEDFQLALMLRDASARQLIRNGIEHIQFQGWALDMRPAPSKPSPKEKTEIFTPLPSKLTDAQKVILGVGGF